MTDENKDFQTFEDDIIILLNKLSETIETFKTLSREQAENAILETNTKLNILKEILDKMEQYIKDLNDEEESEKNELNKKLLNYKTEYHDILNRFNEIQDDYINKKAENALMDENNESNLIDEDENKKRNSKLDGATGAGDPYKIDGELNDTTKNNIKDEKKDEKKDEEKEEKNENKINNKNNKKEINNEKNNSNEIKLISMTNSNIILEHNNSNAIGYALNPNKEKEETLHQIKKDNTDKKRMKIIIVCACLCAFIFILIFFIAILSY